MTQFIRPNITAMAGYIPGEQPTDTTTIKLNTNENPYPPSPRVLDAIRSVTAEQLRRYPSPSAAAFREAAAKVHGLPADWFLTFNGGDELLSVAVRACAGETGKVAYLDPSYSLYPVLADMQGARKVVVEYGYEEGSGSRVQGSGADTPRWVMPDGIENTDAAILLVVNPNAPTGHFNPLATLEKIAATFRGILVIDEAYADFAPENALGLVQKFPNVLLLRTMSKGYGLAGLRFGYGIAQPALLRELEKVRDSYPNDALSIAAATAAITDQPYARATWQKVIAERTRLTAALRKLAFAVPDSASNFVLAQVPPSAPPPPRPSAPSTQPSALAIYQYLKSRGILVRYWDLPRIADKLRITVGTPEQNDRLLTELAAMLR